jgi:hypothetical protein
MFEHDIFISYTHLDNERLHDSDRGWIDLLHQRLEIRLAQLLGENPKIWRDPKLSGNDDFADRLMAKLSGAASLVSVLSPRYLKSEWCRRELGEFHMLLSQSAGVTIDGKSRIFKVIKTPINRGEHPEETQKSLGYEFYEIDPTTNRFREFGYALKQDYDQRYWNKLEDLAQDIKDLIERGRLSPGMTPATSIQPSGKTIFLAETTSDLNEQRDRIRRELLLNGHRVSPHKPLPLNRRIREEVKSCLAESQISVHFIGADYGVVPEGESVSVVELQYELARERNGQNGFSPILWMPKDLGSSDERQQKFIELVLNSNGDLLSDRLEGLKDFIHAKLNPPKAATEQKLPTNGNGSHDPKLVYLICDQPDYNTIAPIEEYLFQLGFEVSSLASDAEPQMHRENLLHCDAVLTYCGATHDRWLELKKMDLFKLRGERTKPMLAKAFYISSPQTTGKERFRIQDALVIRNYGDFHPDSLNPFIEQIENGKGAPL